MPARRLLCRYAPFRLRVSRTATGPLRDPHTQAERWREQSTPIPTRRGARPGFRRARCPPRRGQTLLERRSPGRRAAPTVPRPRAHPVALPSSADHRRPRNLFAVVQVPPQAHDHEPRRRAGARVLAMAPATTSQPDQGLHPLTPGPRRARGPSANHPPPLCPRHPEPPTLGLRAPVTLPRSQRPPLARLVATADHRSISEPLPHRRQWRASQPVARSHHLPGSTCRNASGLRWLIRPSWTARIWLSGVRVATTRLQGRNKRE